MSVPEKPARLVAATNRQLEQMVEDGAFRADLYYRLNIFPVVLPPLRDRPQDLRPLAEHLLERHSLRMHRQPPTISADTWRALEAYDWPGNVRELENTLERALILSPGSELVVMELGRTIRTIHSHGSSNETQRGDPATRPETPQKILPFDTAVTKLLRQALDETGGRIYGPDGAATLLGLKPTTLQGKLRKHGLR